MINIKGSFFKKLILSYLFFSIVPFIIILFLSHFYITPEFYHNELNYSFRMLEHIMHSVDLIFYEVNRMVLNYAVEKDFYKATIIDTNTDVFFTSQTIDKLSTIKSVNKNLHSVYLYSIANEKILHNEKYYLSLRDFFDKRFVREFIDSDEDYDIKSRIISVPEDNEGHYENTNVISIVRYLRDKSGLLVFNVYEESLKKIIGSFIGEDGQVFIVDEKGNLISHFLNDYNRSDSIGIHYLDRIITGEQRGHFSVYEMGTEKVVSFVKSRDSFWIYVNITETENLKALSRRITFIVGVLSIICIIFGVLCVYLFSKKIYSPIRILLSDIKQIVSNDIPNIDIGSLKSNMERIDEFRYINSVINKISSEGKNLKEKLSNSKALAEERMLQKLLTGENKGSALLSIDFKKKCFAVVTVEMDNRAELTYHMGEKEIKKAQGCIETMVRRNYEENGCDVRIVNFGQKRVTFIINYDCSQNDVEPADTILDIADSVQRSLDEYGSSITIGIGEIVRSTDELVKSYHQSNNAIDYKMLYGNGQILYINDLRSRKSRNYLDMDRVVSGGDFIIDAVVAMDHRRIEMHFEEAVNTLLQIGAEISYIRILFLQYIGILSGIPYKLNIEIEENTLDITYQSVISYKTISQMKNYITRLARQIVGAYEKENNRRNRIVDDVKKYIIENYSDQDISLDLLAGKFAISKYHLSRVFKEKTGQNYIEFLKQVRSEKAKDLLRDTDMDIKEIAEKIGYTTPNSFSRMFKQQINLSPSSYRNMIRDRFYKTQ